MLDLDQIEERVGRGTFSEKDVLDLLHEAPALDAEIISRFSAGLRSPADVQALYGAVESAYATAYQRPTAAQRVAQERAEQEQALTDAKQARADEARAKALAEEAARNEWFQTALTVLAEQQTAVQVQASVERFRVNQKLADDVVAEKTARAKAFLDVLNAPTTQTPAQVAPVMGTNDPTQG